MLHLRIIFLCYNKKRFVFKRLILTSSGSVIYCCRLPKASPGETVDGIGMKIRVKGRLSHKRHRGPRCGHTRTGTPSRPVPQGAPGRVNKEMEATTISKTGSNKYAAKRFSFLSFLDCFSSIKLDCTLAQNTPSAGLDSFPRAMPHPRRAQWHSLEVMTAFPEGRLCAAPFLCSGHPYCSPVFCGSTYRVPYYLLCLSKFSCR